MRALVLALASLALSPRQELPEEPAEPFTVFVEADPDANDEVFEEVVRGIRKRKEWLFLTEDPDKAETVVRILAHRVAQDMVPGFANFLHYQARRPENPYSASDYVNVNSLSERHYVVADASLFGLTRVLIGRDKSTKAAKMERAASDLARELEDFLKTGYFRLAEDRRRHPDTQEIEEVKEARPSSDPELRYAHAASLEKSGALLWEEPELVEAEAIYRSLAEDKAPFPDLAVHRAHVLFLLDREGEAREVLEQADLEEASPNARFAAWVLKGEIARRRENWGLAREAFATAKRIDPACRPCAIALEEARERKSGGTPFEVVASWLAFPSFESPDRWWRFLLGPAGEVPP